VNRKRGNPLMRTSTPYLAFTLSLLALAACDKEPLATEPDTGEAPATLSAGATAAPLSFYQVSAGGQHSCGVTVDNRLYCWGDNFSGQLGNGTTNPSRTPVLVAGGLSVAQVSAGVYRTCAVTTGWRAYCWGNNPFGEVGDGTTITRLTPVPVAGGRQFRQVDTRGNHTCAVAYTDNRGYCWGWNYEGQLGDGTRIDRTRPVAVAATLRFKEVRTGGWHSCGVTSDNRAFCWGRNSEGQLGDRTDIRRRTKPTLVADGHQFRQLAAGYAHNCAVRTDKRAFCWGDGRSGQLGNGKRYLSFWPRAVAGGLLFDRVTTGMHHSCGETTTDRAYCWGGNGWGELGDGTTQGRLTPVAVAGGHLFLQLSAGYFHTCGKTNASEGYCWGDNHFGQLGDGTNQQRHTPTPVVGPS
jgi:alpha-tubulin suppressor-like RCC1 family protein